jgi:hypothetical protein
VTKSTQLFTKILKFEKIKKNKLLFQFGVRKNLFIHLHVVALDFELETCSKLVYEKFRHLKVFQKKNSRKHTHLGYHEVSANIE